MFLLLTFFLFDRKSRLSKVAGGERLAAGGTPLALHSFKDCCRAASHIVKLRCALRYEQRFTIGSARIFTNNGFHALVPLDAGRRDCIGMQTIADPLGLSGCLCALKVVDRLHPCAQFRTTRQSLNELPRSLRKQWLAPMEKFDIALRFDLNAPYESAKISLTAFARFVKCTGFFALVLVALMLSGSFINMAIMCAAVHNLPCFHGVGPKIEIFKLSFSAQASPLTAFLEQSCTHTYAWTARQTE
jgi:hypothetical protein|tara:strand:- start:26 stop:760 length:735 start_codon:yes stop_codon:yes gene_type:complete